MANVTDTQTVEGLLDTKSFRTQALVQDTTASTITLTSSSELLIIFTGTTAGQIIKLTNATSISIGHRYEIHNNSTQDVTVQDNDGTNLLILTANQRVNLVLQIAGTAAGTWSIVESEKITGSTSGSVTSVFNDFLLDVFHTHSMIDSIVLNSGVATMDTTTIDNSYGGSFTLSTGTAIPLLTTAGKSIAINNTSLTIKAGGQTVEWRCRLPVLPDGTAVNPNFDVKVGTQDTSAVGDPANGIYFQYNSLINGGKWVGITRNSSISTSVNSSITFAANEWIRLKYVVNQSGTAVSFYINDTYVGTSISNIPSNNGCRLQVSIEKAPFNINLFLPTDVNIATEVITHAAHRYVNTNRVIFTTTGTLPSPLISTTIYYVVGATTNTFQVSTTSGGAAVNFTTTGTGTHTASQVSGTASLTQFDWYSYSIIRG